MQLVREEYIDDKTQLGIGLIDGIDPALLEQHPKGEKLRENNNQERQQQCSTAIALLQSLLDRSSVDLDYNDFGKPILRNTSKAVSISHSKNYVGVLVGEAKALGCDLEVPHPRIKKIAPRFMHAEEWHTIDPENEVIQLTTYWSAKEALYKLYGKKGLRFKEHIRIEPFKIEKNTVLKGYIRKNSVEAGFQLPCNISNELITCAARTDKSI